MNPVNSKFLVEHPLIPKDEFRPKQNDNGTFSSKIVRVFENGFPEDKELRFEDGPGKKFILRVSHFRMYRQATATTEGLIGAEELPVDQDSVNRIEKPTADAVFEGADFVCFLGIPACLREWAGINHKSMGPRA